jgi:hypothetical protein
MILARRTWLRAQSPNDALARRAYARADVWWPAMATWMGCIVETTRRADFWEVARQHDVVAVTGDVLPYVLVDCDDVTRSMSLARDLSHALAAAALGFVAQTNADVHQIHAYASGECVRRLEYSRDEGGWLVVEGTPQAWEPAYFFDPTDDPDDELSESEHALYEHAKRAGDPTPIIRLVRLHSTAPLWRVCEHFGIAADTSMGRWTKQSRWSRLFGRGRAGR